MTHPLSFQVALGMALAGMGPLYERALESRLAKDGSVEMGVLTGRGGPRYMATKRTVDGVWDVSAESACDSIEREHAARVNAREARRNQRLLARGALRMTAHGLVPA